VVAGAVRDGVRRIEGVHHAIARRSWPRWGSTAQASKAVHDVVAGVAYGAVGVGLTAAGAVAAGTLDALVRSGRLGELSASPSGVAILAVLDAFAGDHLDRQRSPLALPMTIRHDGHALPLGGDERDEPDGPAEREEPGGSAGPDGAVERDRSAERDGPGGAEGPHGADGRDGPGGTDGPETLAVAGLDGLPGLDAAGEVVVFVHGLASWEGVWWFGGDDGPAASYGDRLRQERGLTPLYARYNSGLPVAENGRRLADLLTRLAQAWPVPLDRLHLVGHSMGGLVVRSACHVGAERGDPWAEAVGSCVYLGTPHLGAPLARAAVALGSLLVRVPELRPFATLLERPSGGIRDLRFGLPLAADVDEADPTDWFGRDLADVPLLPSARHHAVSAALTGRPGSPVDRVLGDLLVLTASASGAEQGRRRLGLVATDGAAVAPAHHLSLLNHPAVLARLGPWFDADAALASR
jgi:hypothetical protein